jgi:hypothetical protein
MTQPYGRIEWSAAEIAEQESKPRPRFSGLVARRARLSMPFPSRRASLLGSGADRGEGAR